MPSDTGADMPAAELADCRASSRMHASGIFGSWSGEAEELHSFPVATKFTLTSVVEGLVLAMLPLR